MDQQNEKLPARILAESLERPFKDSIISIVKKGNVELSYIPVSHMIQRMNDTFGPLGWSYTVEKMGVETHVLKKNTETSWVVTKVTVSVLNPEGEGSSKEIIREAFGSARVNSWSDVADVYKSAVSVGLKKALQSFGIGLYLALFEGEEEETESSEDDRITEEQFEKLCNALKVLSSEDRTSFGEWFNQKTNKAPRTRESFSRSLYVEAGKLIKSFDSYNIT